MSINDKNFDLAINLAAQAGVRVSKDKEHLYESSNIQGFKSFCNFCKKKRILIRLFMHQAVPFIQIQIKVKFS